MERRGGPFFSHALSALPLSFPLHTHAHTQPPRRPAHPARSVRRPAGRGRRGCGRGGHGRGGRGGRGRAGPARRGGGRRRRRRRRRRCRDQDSAPDGPGGVRALAGGRDGDDGPRPPAGPGGRGVWRGPGRLGRGGHWPGPQTAAVGGWRWREWRRRWGWRAGPGQRDGGGGELNVRGVCVLAQRRERRRDNERAEGGGGGGSRVRVGLTAHILVSSRLCCCHQALSWPLRPAHVPAHPPTRDAGEDAPTPMQGPGLARGPGFGGCKGEKCRKKPRGAPNCTVSRGAGGGGGGGAPSPGPSPPPFISLSPPLPLSSHSAAHARPSTGPARPGEHTRLKRERKQNKPFPRGAHP